MASRYTNEEKRIFAKAYAGNHNITQAFKKIRPTADDGTACSCGKRLLRIAQVKEQVEQFEKENQAKAQAEDKFKLLDIEERRKALAEMGVTYKAMMDPQCANVAQKAIDMLNKMDGVYIDKKQIEVSTSLADIIRGVGDVE